MREAKRYRLNEMFAMATNSSNEIFINPKYMNIPFQSSKRHSNDSGQYLSANLILILFYFLLFFLNTQSKLNASDADSLN